MAVANVVYDLKSKVNRKNATQTVKLKKVEHVYFISLFLPILGHRVPASPYSTTMKIKRAGKYGKRAKTECGSEKNITRASEAGASVPSK